LVCVQVPVDQETRALIGAEALGHMHRGAIVVNAAHGPVVDEKTLIDALESGHLGGAALDVFEIEPTPVDNPLRGFENVFMSPHLHGATLEAEELVLSIVGDNLNRILDGEEPLNTVNGVGLAARR
jgi:D-3-phosphoglycerate dehydrogenase / 2-oxoglutarate reductase